MICPNHKKIIEYLANQLDDEENAREKIEERLESQKTINKKLAELKQMLDESPEVLSRLQIELTEHCRKQGIERFETPAKLIFVKEIWTPDTGLVTDSLKLKRKQLEQFYSAEISAAY